MRFNTVVETGGALVYSPRHMNEAICCLATPLWPRGRATRARIPQTNLSSVDHVATFRRPHLPVQTIANRELASMHMRTINSAIR
jgi:hypothetical protein